MTDLVDERTGWKFDKTRVTGATREKLVELLTDRKLRRVDELGEKGAAGERSRERFSTRF